MVPMLDRVLGVKDGSADIDSSARKALLPKLRVAEAEKEEPTFYWSKTVMALDLIDCKTL